MKIRRKKIYRNDETQKDIKIYEMTSFQNY